MPLDIFPSSSCDCSWLECVSMKADESELKILTCGIKVYILLKERLYPYKCFMNCCDSHLFLCCSLSNLTSILFNNIFIDRIYLLFSSSLLILVLCQQQLPFGREKAENKKKKNICSGRVSYQFIKLYWKIEKKWRHCVCRKSCYSWVQM